jgi:phenylacetic acid degradation operon negative regulatory protein
VRLVPFLFGLARRTGLPGPVLVRLLTDLALSESAARGLIARMQRAGQLAGTRHGRTVHYRLAGSFAQAFERIRTAPAPPAWQGAFHALLYQVPENRRAFRDQLRRAAVLAGYGVLQQGVLIALTDRRHELAGILADRPRDSHVYFGQLAMATPDAARAAATAWDLPDLGRTFQAQARRLRAVLARRAGPPRPTGATLRRFENLVSAPLTDTLRASGLPAELLPEDWPLPDLRAALDEVMRHYGPPCGRYVAGLLAGPA